MAVTQDGTQVFGIAASPVTINSVTYILEDIKLAAPSRTVKINNPDGTPLGQAIVPEALTLTGKLQLASSSTAIPTVGQTTSSINSVTYYIQTVGQAYTQGAYGYVDITAIQKLN
jgi:hypothetical protein